MIDDPLDLFSDWYALARERDPAPQVTALATAAASGAPAVRMVELQRFDASGFVFYTGAGSRKGRELAENPRAALCFYWHESNHQARLEGPVERDELDPEEARAALAAADIGGRQDEVVGGREELEELVEAVRARHGPGLAPLPVDWAAFRLVPDRYEFWEARAGGLHERIRYRRDGSAWRVERLFP